METKKYVIDKIKIKKDLAFWQGSPKLIEFYSFLSLEKKSMKDHPKCSTFVMTTIRAQSPKTANEMQLYLHTEVIDEIMTNFKWYRNLRQITINSNTKKSNKTSTELD